MSNKRQNPNEITKLSLEDYNLLKRTLKERADSFIHFGPKKYTEDDYYATYSQEIYNFPIRSNDTWVVTMPRCGTTLTQEMVWQICNQHDLKVQKPLIERFPYFEFPLSVDNATLKQIRLDHPEKLDKINRLFLPEWDKEHPEDKPRFYKSHWPFSMLPPELLTKGCKVVYVARNPKDQLVSRYRFYETINKPLPEDFADFWLLQEKSLLPCTPYFDHIIEAWQQRHNPNVLFLFYENIVKDMRGSIVQVAKFLQRPITEQQIEDLAQHLHIDNFRKNKSVNDLYLEYFSNKNDGFIRSGKNDVWKEELFTKELNQRADKWIQDWYKKTDMRFPTIP